jgi:DNA-binding beta-propeller fold protein YncE
MGFRGTFLLLLIAASCLFSASSMLEGAEAAVVHYHALGLIRPEGVDLNAVSKVAVAADGGVYLADFDQRRVVKVQADGTVAFIVDGRRTPELTYPGALAALPDGGFVVANGGTVGEQSLLRFDETGRLTRVLYRNPPGEQTVRYMLYLAAAPDGTVHILDHIALKVHRVDLDGKLLPSLSLSKAREDTATMGGLAVTRDAFYTCGGRNPRPRRYRLTGEWERDLDLPADGYADTLTTDPAGNLLTVIRTGRADRVARYGPDGALTEVWTPVRGETPGEALSIRALGAPAEGKLITLETGAGTTETGTLPPRLQRWERAAAPGAGMLRVVRSNRPREAAPAVARRLFAIPQAARLGRLTAPVVDRRGVLYVGENYGYWVPEEGFPDAARQELRARILGIGAAGAASVRLFGEEAFLGKDGYPPSVAALVIGPGGLLYAVSGAEGKILVFDREHRPRGSIPLPAGFRTQIWQPKPFDLAAGPDGELYFPDDLGNRIFAYDPGAKQWEPFGSWGEGPQGFHSPVAVTVAPDGGLYVADLQNARVTRLDRTRRYRYEIRHRHPNEEQDQEPWDVEATRDGGAVAAYGTCIARFDPEGGLVWHWQAPGEEYLFTWSTGSSGASREGGLGVAPDGTVHFARYGGDVSEDSELITLRPGRRTSAREPLQVVKKLRFSAAGQGQFNHPCGVAADGQGHVYVCDFNNHRVQKLDGDGRFLLQFGLSGSENWGFFYGSAGAPDDPRKKWPDEAMLWPSGVAVDDGRRLVYVADWGARRVQVFSPDGKWLRHLATGVRPWGIALDAEGTVYITEPETRTVRVLAPDGTTRAVLGEAEGLRLRRPGMLGVFQERIYVTDRETSEVIVYDLSRRQEVRRYGKGLLRHPDGIAVSRGMVCVADTSNHRVAFFHEDGKFQYAIGGRGAGEWQFFWPKGVCLGPEGGPIVTEWGNDRVQKLPRDYYRKPALVWGGYSTQNAMMPLQIATAVPSGDALFTGSALVTTAGAVLRTFGQQRVEVAGAAQPYLRTEFANVQDGICLERGYAALESGENGRPGPVRLRIYAPDGTAAASFPLPVSPTPFWSSDRTGVTVKPQMAVFRDRLFITDPEGGGVLVTDLLGQERGRIGRERARKPGGVAVDGKGELFVSDPLGHRIQVYSPGGKLLREFGKPGWEGGGLLFPTSIALAGDGTLYVLDSGNRRVKRFDRNGRFLAASAALGNETFHRVTAAAAAVYLTDGWRLWVLRGQPRSDTIDRERTHGRTQGQSEDGGNPGG